MVKDTGVTQPTDKIRLGRFTECYQPHNSIVLNASNAKIDNIHPVTYNLNNYGLEK